METINILFEAGEFYVYQAEPWELSAFEGDTYIVATEMDGWENIIGEFDNLEDAEDLACNLYDEMINPEDYDD